ncbi:hypothetical protein HELRODRAFT_193822 [Helobdella robusta]|uniref:Major facilitator superfamily (MFS) profile domain-containing protein n=1 Tax=Helobdella robusta TaxID=6412 RepID=T1FVE2_HELRO|nr:hypothetical protein HELRODRAFT_193822 [Helobdella robusta]ESN94057.1 hypothetical protein HELRODRAFT_193822 [Helobdella robusta]
MTTTAKQKRIPPLEELEAPLPPDGGWGWVVMVASFFSNLLVDGILYTFGILYINLIHSFPEAHKATISMVGSLLGGVYLIVGIHNHTGPFVGGLVNKFGCRVVACCGAIVSSAAFIASYFSHNIEMMLVTYGIFGGIGFGLLYLPSIVMVGMYFDRKRALATGIAVCGSGLGTLLFAPLATYLCDTYGWRGANLIMAGLILNGLPCALVYKPLKAKKKRKKIYMENYKDSIKKDPSQATSTSEFLKLDTDPTATVAKVSSSTDDEELPDVHPLYRADVLYGGSVTNIAEYNANPDMRAYVNSVTDIPRAVSPSPEGGPCAPLLDVLRKMFDFTLLASPTFIAIALSGVFGFMGFYSPFVYLTDYAQISVSEHPERANWLISTIGLSNTVSRILAGWLADRPWADSTLIHNMALILAGLATCSLTFFSNMVAFYAYAITFGFSIAAFIALRSIVICDLLGVQRLTNAFGIVALFQGIALLLGTPVSGAIYDCTGSYKLSFIVSGIMMVLGGVLCLPVRKINRWEIRRNKSREPLIQLRSNAKITNDKLWLPFQIR